MSGASMSHPEGRKNLTMLIPVLQGGGSAGMELHVKAGHGEEGGHCVSREQEEG